MTSISTPSPGGDVPCLVLYGPLNERTLAAARRLSERTGFCEVDARNFYEKARRSSADLARLVVDEIEQNERCHRGFVLHEYPRTMPEEQQFERELLLRFGPRSRFAKFSALFLDPRQDEASEPIIHRDNPEYDPYAPSYKQAVARAIAVDTSNWIYDRVNLMNHFIKTRRLMNQVDVHKPADETATEVISILTQGEM
jgi:adenylate kinase family enzyme